MPAPHIRAFSDGSYLLEFDELGSTQDEATSRAKAGEERLVGVRADHQVHGRGRRGTDWHAPRGQCLLVTYLAALDNDILEAPAVLSMASSLAVADAVAHLTGLDPHLRWPNDVLLGSRKLAGTLVEMLRLPLGHRPTRHVAAIGIGLNVNVAVWPEPLVHTAVSLRQATGRTWSVEAVEAAVRTALIDVQRQIATPDPHWLHRRWNERDATVGRRFLSHDQRGPITGTAYGISPDGHLLLRTDQGVEIRVASARHIS
ncbi:MAG: biotin--[acetyl-CoA-carboxylase] ligase [Armatimonadetes bacterium]|nr:biotin--[acetyl-CoA-carboxylase] ligase [Armatimonadota bacterium]